MHPCTFSSSAPQACVIATVTLAISVTVTVTDTSTVTASANLGPASHLLTRDIHKGGQLIVGACLIPTGAGGQLTVIALGACIQRQLLLHYTPAVQPDFGLLSNLTHCVFLCFSACLGDRGFWGDNG